MIFLIRHTITKNLKSMTICSNYVITSEMTKYHLYHRKHLQMFSNISETAFSRPTGQTHRLFKQRCFLTDLWSLYQLQLDKHVITRCYHGITCSNLTNYSLYKHTSIFPCNQNRSKHQLSLYSGAPAHSSPPI